MFLVVAVIAWFAAYYSVKYFFRYIGDSKLAAGKNTAKTMGEIYDEGVEEKDDKIYDILDQFGLDYFLSDKDGKVVFSSGENKTGCTLVFTLNAERKMHPEARSA